MNTDNSSFNTYLNNIGGARRLSDDEEQALAARIARGDDKALDRLVTANLTYVVKLAGEYRGRGLETEEIVSEGNMGLIAAARSFDGSKGKRFVTFAAPYIREKIERAIERQTGLYRVPRDAKDPAAEKRRSRALSIDAPIGGSAELSLGRVVPDKDAPVPDEAFFDEVLREELERLVSRLDEREQHVVRSVYGIGRPALTMAETGEEMGLRRERVRRIRDKAVRHICRLTKNNRLKSYLMK